MLQQLFDPAARLWLLAGVKYSTSAGLAGEAWAVPVSEALRAHGLALDDCRTLFEAVGVFRKRWRWVPDPAFQLWDVVYPPAQLLARGGDDCDGWAMAHAQAADHVLGRQGWKTVIISYYADPWQLSHHFAVAIDPRGGCWILQPQPSAEQADDTPTVFGPFPSIEDCANIVASWYGAKASWWDARTPMWDTRPA